MYFVEWCEWFGHFHTFSMWKICCYFFLFLFALFVLFSLLYAWKLHVEFHRISLDSMTSMETLLFGILCICQILFWTSFLLNYRKIGNRVSIGIQSRSLIGHSERIFNSMHDFIFHTVRGLFFYVGCVFSSRFPLLLLLLYTDHIQSTPVWVSYSPQSAIELRGPLLSFRFQSQNTRYLESNQVV